MTYKVQLWGSLMSYGGLTVISVDFFQLKSGFLSQSSQFFFNEMTIVEAQTRNLAIEILKGQFPVISNWTSHKRSHFYWDTLYIYFSGGNLHVCVQSQIASRHIASIEEIWLEAM